jgi:hypothetical protein
MRNYFFSILFIFSSFLVVSCDKNANSLNTKNEPYKSALKPVSIDGLPAQVNPGNYITFDSDNLSSTADLIIIGQPMSNLSESKKVSKKNIEKTIDKIEFNTSLVYTDEDGKIIDYQIVTPVKVKKVLKGNPQDKVIGVSQRGAVVDANPQPFVITTEGFTPLDKGSKYILFLKEINASEFPNMVGLYSIISINQGKFNLDKSDKQEEMSETKDLQYKNLKEQIRNKYKQDFDSAP